MERAPGHPRSSSLLFDWSWRRITWQLLPVLAIVSGAFLLARDHAGGGNSKPAPLEVDADNAQRRAAHNDFFEAHVADTNDSLSYNRLTSLYLERLRLTGDAGDVTKAELAAQKGLDLTPNGYASVIAMAQVRLAQHDFDQVFELVARADAIKPNVPDTLAVRGDAELATGRYEAAATDYHAFLDKAAGCSAYSRMALLAETDGNLDLAIQFWTAAIDSSRDESPVDSAWARVQLGNLYATNGKLDDASKQYDTALKVNPGYALAEAGQARVAAMRGQFEKSATLYKDVTAKLPSPEFVAAYADVATRAGQPQVAAQQAALIGAIAQLFEVNGIKNDLNILLFRLDHSDVSPETLAAAKAAYAERPSLAAADVYGWALYRAGQYEEASKYAAEALSRSTREPLYFFHAGMIAAARGDAATARAELGRALELNPRFHPVHADEARAELKRFGASK
jgi:tetratricopeptide (TPR) repeat protein